MEEIANAVAVLRKKATEFLTEQSEQTSTNVGNSKILRLPPNAEVTLCNPKKVLP
jgi:hypothetical protein